jgi:hypothetical protein
VLEDLVLFDSVIFCFLETNKQKKKKKRRRRRKRREKWPGTFSRADTPY